MALRGSRVALFVALAFLSGCVGGGKDTAGVACPETGILQDAGDITVFKDGADQKLENVVASARLVNYSGGCSYKNGQVRFQLNLDFQAVQGAEGKKLKRFDFPYFIAILSPEEEVLQRQSFSTTVPFDNKRQGAAAVDASRTHAVYLGGAGTMMEEHHLALPVESRDTVRQHKVVVGFALTPEQLAFNRDDAADKKKDTKK